MSERSTWQSQRAALAWESTPEAAAERINAMLLKHGLDPTEFRVPRMRPSPAAAGAKAARPASSTVAAGAKTSAGATGGADPLPGGDSPSDPLRVSTVSDCLQSGSPGCRQQWLVEGMVGNGTLNMLVGAPGAGKTYAGLDLALHVARGESWLGVKVRKSGVVYIDEEMGVLSLAPRMRQLGYTPDVQVAIVGRQGFCVNNRAHIAQVMKTASSIGAELVIIDSLTASHKYTEGSNDDMSRLREDLRPLLDAGVAVLFLHHPRKSDGDREILGINASRGAADIVAMMDSVFGLRRGDGVRTIHPVKTRLLPEEDAPHIDFRLERSGGDTVRLVKVEPGADGDKEFRALRRRILEVLADGAPQKSTDVVAACGKRRPAVLEAADRLAEEGIIVREVRRERGAPIYYALAA